MREPPAGFATDQVTHALSRYWGLHLRRLEYLAVGFGAHHWQAIADNGTSYFLAVHELGRPGDVSSSLRRLEQALGTARWLESQPGLEYAVGPVPGASGAICRLMAESFALSVYRWLDGEPMRQPDDPRTGQLLARLHRISQPLPPGVAHVEDFVIPHREDLHTALADLDGVWTTGPYAEPCRQALRRHVEDVHALMADYDRAAARAVSSRSDWVVTHGEPFGPNLVQSADGQLYLVDWDSALLAPRERDLWEMPRDGPAWSAYLQLSGARLDDRLLRLYRAWYDLAETAVYVSLFRSPHRGDQNDRQAWDNFLVFLPSRERWPDLV
jgi:spectinomycin phosphotransferase